ncbi:hypothetical protein [Streptomyces chattanoogensis]|uniref:hypothetical protein n=1 Tax=Streptomyces chattanoogensis TaxID=66876 RepID=UPI0036778074
MLRSLPKECSTVYCHARPTHVLEYDDVINGDVVRVHDYVCEECGRSHMRTNQRLRPYLVRNGAAVSVVPPRIRVRVQHEGEPDANRLDDWEDEDAAEIRADRLVPCVIEIIDGAGAVITDLPNRLARPAFEGVYQRPDEIHDEWLAYYAADLWTPCFGVAPGDLVTFGAENLIVINYDQVDQDYGTIGANTGLILCQPLTNEFPRLLVWVEYLEKVREITA